MPVLQMVDLKESATAREQAQRLKARAVEELKRAEAELARNLVRGQLVQHAGATEEIAAARSWLRNPQAARQAIIVSVILGPPVGS
jgi:hypothetical protein